MITVLIESMSHKFNTPLNSIKGFLAFVKVQTKKGFVDQSVTKSLLACEESILIFQQIV
jgi:signal transduction histidine kinase